MEVETIHKIYEILQKDNLSFIYQGEFSSDMTEMILGLSEYNINNVRELGKLKKRVFFLMVESFQNIIKHGDDIQTTTEIDSRGSGMFFTRNIGSIYYIASANLIKNEFVEMLKSKLNNIISLDKEGLKALYLEILAHEEFSVKGGAGLGLIEMARKSNQKLEFEFEKVNDELSFFYLQIKVHSKDLPTDEITGKHFPLDIVKEFHNKMISGNILMIHKGDFTQESILPVLRMIEENMMHQKVKVGTRKRVFMILVEMLQNISRHSNKHDGIKDGIFIIGKKDEQYIIGTGNLIDNDNVESLKNKLTIINKLDKEELSDMYKESLKKKRDMQKRGAGLGLIDIARESSAKLDFEFVSINGKESFYSLIARI